MLFTPHKGIVLSEEESNSVLGGYLYERVSQVLQSGSWGILIVSTPPLSVFNRMVWLCF